MSCLIDDVMWQVVSSLWSSVMLMLRVDYRCVVVASSLLLSIAFAVLLFYCIVEVYGHSVFLCRCSSTVLLCWLCLLTTSRGVTNVPLKKFDIAGHFTLVGYVCRGFCLSPSSINKSVTDIIRGCPLNRGSHFQD